jgi:hypothetical protein
MPDAPRPPPASAQRLQRLSLWLCLALAWFAAHVLTRVAPHAAAQVLTRHAREARLIWLGLYEPPTSGCDRVLIGPVFMHRLTCRRLAGARLRRAPARRAIAPAPSPLYLPRQNGGLHTSCAGYTAASQSCAVFQSQRQRASAAIWRRHGRRSIPHERAPDADDKNNAAPQSAGGADARALRSNPPAGSTDRRSAFSPCAPRDRIAAPRSPRASSPKPCG